MNKPTSEETGVRRGPVAWHVSHDPVDYLAAEAFMRARANGIFAGEACELVWFLEHPSVYTAGTSAQPEDLLEPDRYRVIKTGRGGQYTYHGPGQRVVYVMLDLRARGGCDVRRFVSRLHSLVRDALAPLGISGETRADRVGIWVDRSDGTDRAHREDKIAAVGIRLVRWISLHGFSVNVSVDLSHFEGIVACGISEHGVTSLKDLGAGCSMAQVDVELKRAFCDQFGAQLVDARAGDPVVEFH